VTEQEEVRFASVDEEVSIVQLQALALSSEGNIYMNIVTLTDDMKDKLPARFKEIDEALLVVFCNADKTISLSVLMPIDVAQKMATVILTMGWLSSRTHHEEGGVNDVFSGRAGEQEVKPLGQESTEGVGAHPEPTDASEQDEPAEGNEGKEVKVNRPLPA
jgi:hypothetical protein